MKKKSNIWDEAGIMECTTKTSKKYKKELVKNLINRFKTARKELDKYCGEDGLIELSSGKKVTKLEVLAYPLTKDDLRNIAKPRGYVEIARKFVTVETFDNKKKK